MAKQFKDNTLYYAISTDSDTGLQTVNVVKVEGFFTNGGKKCMWIRPIAILNGYSNNFTHYELLRQAKAKTSWATMAKPIKDDNIYYASVFGSGTIFSNESLYDLMLKNKTVTDCIIKLNEQLNK